MSGRAAWRPAHRVRTERRPRRVELRAVTTLAAAVAISGALLGTGRGYPMDRPHLLSGTAWVASSGVGQVTLLDGSSAEVAAQVQVSSPGHGLEVVQDGARAYAIDATTGTIRAVDGATFDTTAAASPIPGAAGGLRAFAGSDMLYALDSGRGVLVGTDPRTLAARTDPIPLASRVDRQGVVVDAAGRLWLVDAASGDLLWIDRGRRRIRPAASRPGAGRLVVAGGVPVLVDLTRHTAQTLDPATGTVRHTTRLDLRDDDAVEVTGSSHADRLYVVAAHGSVAICELTAESCDRAVPLAAGESDPGAAVEAENRLFVPDYATGRVWIVDLAAVRVVGQPQVLPPATRFQLLTRDGVVFFNDPNSERAGVIRLDGGVRLVAKYDTRNPGAGAAGGADGKPVPPPATRSGPPTSGPTPPPDRITPPTTPPAAPAPPPGGDLPTVSIVVGTDRPTVGQEVILTLRTGQPAPVQAHWTFDDGTVSDQLQTTHAWRVAQMHTVSVQVTFPDGRPGFASAAIQVVPVPTPTSPSPTPVARHTLTVTVQGHGHVSAAGTGLSCPGTCSVQVPDGTTVQLDASTTTAATTFSGWAGACAAAGSATSCQVTMDGDKGATARFHSRFQLTLNPTEPAGSGPCCEVVLGAPVNATCVFGPCSWTVDEGTSVRLSVTRTDGTSPLVGVWSGACTGTSASCTVTMNKDQTVDVIISFPPG